MSLEELVGVLDVLPAGVVARQRASVFYPTQLPDLIGVKELPVIDLPCHCKISELGAARVLEWREEGNRV